MAVGQQAPPKVGPAGRGRAVRAPPPVAVGQPDATDADRDRVMWRACGAGADEEEKGGEDSGLGEVVDLRRALWLLLFFFFCLLLLSHGLFFPRIAFG